MEIGRVCIKIAGRDAGMKCVVVEQLDNNFVLIDGQTRRRKCNLTHLEPTKEILSIKKGASHDEVVTAFKAIKVEIKEKKTKPKTERPKKQRKVKEKPVKKGKKEKAEEKPKETEEKKAEETEESQSDSGRQKSKGILDEPAKEEAPKPIEEEKKAEEKESPKEEKK